ncbi:MAG TPA: hypothetical protein PKN80_03700 [bacterium]|nr:hypothetical protein [bacterium]HNS49477.1 hypothetical protein [bacterium]
MRHPEKEAALQSVRRVAEFLKSETAPVEPVVYRGFFSGPRYLFYDRAKRRYHTWFDRRRRGWCVRVTPPAGDSFTLPQTGLHFLVTTRSFFVYANFPLAVEYLENFFRRRDYPVDSLSWKETVSLPWWQAVQGTLVSGGAAGSFSINRSRGRFTARFRDENGRPCFCSPRHQYLFIFKPRLRIRDGRVRIEQLLKSYAETEIKTTSPNPLALFKQAVYGFKSANLRAFYSEEGLIPEVRHVIIFVVYWHFALALINASVFVRVAERLKGQTWYTLAAGALVFFRMPAEIINMRRALRLTRNLPGSRLQKIMDSEEFRSIIENRKIRSWRSFERVYTDLFRATEYLAEALERYRLAKPKIYRLVSAGRQAEVPGVLESELGIGKEGLAMLAPLAGRLEALERPEIVRIFTGHLERLRSAGLLRESEWPGLVDFVNRTFPEQLEWDTVVGAYKSLNDRIKRAERNPSRPELSVMIENSKRASIPFRRAELLLMVSFYMIGYGATYLPYMPTLVFPLYYLVYGVLTQLIYSGLERMGTPVSLQYLYKELENDPAVPSASDVWNEYASQQLRLFAVFSSLGLIIGIGGRLLADRTHNISWFAVEALGMGTYLLALWEWFRYWNGLVRRCKVAH